MGGEELLEEMKSYGAIVEGHFIGTSNKHLDTYIAKDAIMPHTAFISRLCKMIAEKALPHEPDIVVGPIACGIIMSQWTAHHLSELCGRNILAVFTDEVESKQKLKRKYNRLVDGARVVVVEDVVNTGASIQEVVDTVSEKGGDIVHAYSLFNRGEPDTVVSKKLGVPYESLIYFPRQAWNEADMPDSLRATPVSVEYGHGGEHISGLKDN
ncbi:MAG: phosphoribosyltransferase family protein [Candidatus Paceibacteria bacterium]